MKTNSAWKICSTIIIIALLLGFSPGLGTLFAQSKDSDFPNRPISVIVPYGPGGGPDIAARLITNYWKKTIGQPVAVVNKPGANGSLGLREISHSKPDGYTLGCMAFPNSPVIVAQKGRDAGFTNDDFIMIGNFALVPDTLSVKNDGPFKNFSEFVDYAKKNPKKISVSIAGPRQMLQLVLIEMHWGIELNPVWFKSGGEVINNLMGGHVLAACGPSQFAISSQEKGVTAIAITGSQRYSKLPNTPTYKELGYEITISMYNPIVAPKGTPDAILRKLTDTLKALENDADFKDKVIASGAIYHPIFPPELTTFYNNTCNTITSIIDKNRSKFKD